jgi:hypothetical protein
VKTIAEIIKMARITATIVIAVAINCKYVVLESAVDGDGVDDEGASCTVANGVSCIVGNGKVMLDSRARTDPELSKSGLLEDTKLSGT